MTPDAARSAGARPPAAPGRTAPPRNDGHAAGPIGSGRPHSNVGPEAFAPDPVPPPRVPAASPVPAPSTAEAPETAEAPSTADDGVPEGPASSRRPSRLRRALLPLVVAAVAAFVAATAYLAISEPHTQSSVGRWTGGPEATASPQAGPFGPAQEPGANDRSAGNPFSGAASVAAGPPTRLRIPAIGVDTPLVALRLGDDGQLVPPTDFGSAGWYAGGTAPGDPGPAIIAGHVDSRQGPAIFYRLRELAAGDRIDVTRGGESVRFRVISTAWYPKKKFPTEKVYGPTPDRQLRLITCGGVFDRHLRSYEDNLVVYAVAG
ncbi:class F sortase [Mangrovihabitans endophyticus]|uniref:Sortase family protein n=1 Tax=Mangrovihabitans endophyticus TaxID=1751298 RepID=A0A8J3FN82_9ACTN|nr:class F sortase [Mangrovihabitans endophyticus]GGK90683.1 hypothetical protein GCM10012284_25610 [Mangrovihabitans endophyticus]